MIDVRPKDRSSATRPRSQARLAVLLSAFCTTWLTGCQLPPPEDGNASRSSYDATTTALPPLRAPVQLRYQPFKEIRYRLTLVKKPNDPSPETQDYTVTGLRSGDNILILVHDLPTIQQGQSVARDPGYNGSFRVLISRDGRILNDRALQADPNYRVLMSARLELVLPIYIDRPVGSGEQIARTIEHVDPNGESYDTLILRGEMDVNGKKGLWLDFQRTIFEKKNRPDVSDSYPRQGHIIVDPTNGTVLQYRWVGANGGAMSLDKM